MLKPEDQWRKSQVKRWYSSWAPERMAKHLRRVWPEEKPISWEDLTEEMDKSVQIPSYANAWLFPIRTRIDMITTGIPTTSISRIGCSRAPTISPSKPWLTSLRQTSRKSDPTDNRPKRRHGSDSDRSHIGAPPVGVHLKLERTGSLSIPWNPWPGRSQSPARVKGGGRQVPALSNEGER